MREWPRVCYGPKRDKDKKKKKEKKKKEKKKKKKKKKETWKYVIRVKITRLHRVQNVS